MNPTPEQDPWKQKQESKPLLTDQRASDLLKFEAAISAVCRAYRFELFARTNQIPRIAVRDISGAPMPAHYDHVAETSGFDTVGAYTMRAARGGTQEKQAANLRCEFWNQAIAEGEPVWDGPFDPPDGAR